MFLSKTKYTIRDSVRSVTRHKLLSFLTLLTITITLTVLSIAGLIALNSYQASQNVEDQLRIVVFLEQPSDDATVASLEKTLKNTKEIVSVEYISKDAALASLNQEFKSADLDIDEALEGDNPLPDSFTVQVDDPENIEIVAKSIEQLESVESVKYGNDVVDNVVSFNKTAKIIGALIVLTMVVATLFLINITIQLTVTNRREEIHIMRLVGATNSFIRWPFFLEGMFLGLVGSILSAGAVYWCYQRAYEYVSENIPFLSLLNDERLMTILIISNIVVGIVLGALGSAFAVRKHLKV